MAKIILASKSPRRRELLTLAGIDHVVETSDADESYPDGLEPREVVCLLAKVKARATAKNHPGETVLGADTVVATDGVILGKPADEKEAADMLRRLSGRTHEVYTGVCIIKPEGEKVFYEKTKVTFYELTEEEIEAYVATGEPMDKAGAYGIQGKGVTLVRKIDGDYSNVVGLPVARVKREL